MLSFVNFFFQYDSVNTIKTKTAASNWLGSVADSKVTSTLSSVNTADGEITSTSSSVNTADGEVTSTLSDWLQITTNAEVTSTSNDYQDDAPDAEVDLNLSSVDTADDKVPSKSNNWLGNATEPLAGFSWKHGITADTKGLMMWSDVFLYDAPNEEKIAIVVVDTQGLFEKGSTPEENAKIFSFITLMSSIQIINIKEKIQENHIAHLQTAIELTNLITMKQGGQSKRKSFQNVVFLLRDFDDEKYEFGFEGGLNYLEDFFDPEESTNETLSEQNSTAQVNRENIRASFDEILCFLLNHPGEIIKKSVFKGEWGLLKPEFVQNLQILIEGLLAPEKLVKKSMLGAEMTGEEFNETLVDLSDCYSTYNMPQLENIFQITIDNQMNAIVKNEVKEYKTAMTSEAIDYDRSDFADWLQKKHNATLAVAIDEFLKADKIEDKPSEEKFKKVLEDKIEEFFKDFWKSNIEAYRVLKTEKEMQAICNKKAKKFRGKLDEEVDYELDNFKQYIEGRHQNLKAVLSEEFVEAAKVYNDTMRSDKFKVKLEEEIEETYKNWKKTVMKNWQKIQIKKFSNLELQNFRQNINSLTDYDMENFESHIEIKRLEFKAEAVQKFLNSTENNFETEIVKDTQTKLEHEIDAAFLALRTSKMKIHRLHMDTRNKVMEIDEHLKFYLRELETDLESNITYGIEDFETEFKRKFQAFSKRAIDRFTNATNKPEYSSKKIASQSKLNQEIEKLYRSLKDSANARNVKKIEENKLKAENDIAEVADAKYLQFKNESRKITYGDSNFAKDSFELDMRNDFESLKDKMVSDFKSDASQFGEPLIQRKYANELSTKIDSYSQERRTNILIIKAEYDERQKIKTKKKLDRNIVERLEEYNDEMQKKAESIYTHQDLKAAHYTAKNSAMNKFNAYSIDYKDLALVESFKTALEKDIKSAFNEHKNNQDKIQISELDFY